MFRLMKWALALAMLTLVLLAALDGKCVGIALSTLEGLAAGIGHGLIVAVSKMEHVRNPDAITTRRLVRLVKHDARVGLVTGLLLGVTYALIAWLS
jgi:hypothetical protein